MSRIETEIAIVGGGLVGCMIACALRRRGRAVVVLERGLVGGQSSGVSFGSLRLQGQHATDLPLALRAHGLWLGIEAELGESVELEQHGHVHLGLTAAHLERLASNANQLDAVGLRPELLDRAEARRRWPFLGEAVQGASWSRHDATVNPRLVTPAFARAALRLGAVIRESAEVLGAEHANGRFTLRARAADGEDLVVVADSLVNAAGAWCGALAQNFGETIPVFAAGPAEIVTEPQPRFALPVMHVVDGSVLFRQTIRGNVIIGGHPRMSVDAESRQVRVPPEKIATNLARLVAIAPLMRGQHVIRTWSGIEGYIADMRPVLGPSATTPGLFHACAFSGHGLQVGPAVAEVLAELIVDGATETPIGAYAIGRFEAGAGRAGHALAEEFQEGVRVGPAHPVGPA